MFIYLVFAIPKCFDIYRIHKYVSPTRFPFQFTVIQGIPRQHTTGHSPLPLRPTENQYHHTLERLTTYPGQDNNACIHKIDIDYLM